MAALHVYCLLLLCTSALMYDFSNTSVRALTVFNFDEQVNKQRTKLPAIVHFYRERDRMTNNLVEELNALAVDWQGAFVIGAVNCGEQEKLCEDQDVLNTPLVKVYPPLPVPTHEYTAEVSAKRMISYLAGYLGGKVEEIREIDLKSFLDKKPGTPKVILFTEKTGVPTIYKALSNTLGETLDFGIVRSDQTAIVTKYAIKTFPKLILVKGTDPKPHVYQGDLKYRPMFEFLNIYSEVFIVADEKGAAPPTKQWKIDPVPELFISSAQDICFSKEGFICAIFLTKTKPTDSEIDLFKSLKSKFTSKIEDRGADVTFMWVNTQQEPEFTGNFEGVEEGLVFLKHGKRNRYLTYTGDMTEAGIEGALARIMGGDGKFTNIKGKFPTFNTASGDKVWLIMDESQEIPLSKEAPAAAPQAVYVYMNVQPPAVTTEEEVWDFEGGCCGFCVKLSPPVVDSFSVIATTPVQYSPCISAYSCHKQYLPFVSTGQYQLQWPTSHSLSIFTNPQELQDTCDLVHNVISPQVHKVPFTQAQQYKTVYYLALIIGLVLAIIGAILRITHEFAGVFILIIGAVILFLNRWLVRWKCRRECRILTAILVQALQAELTRKPGLAALKTTVGAYGTYIRFGFQQPGFSNAV